MVPGLLQNVLTTYEQLKNGVKFEEAKGKGKQAPTGKKESNGADFSLLKGNLSLILSFTEMINSSAFKSKVVKT